MDRRGSSKSRARANHKNMYGKNRKTGEVWDYPDGLVVLGGKTEGGEVKTGSLFMQPLPTFNGPVVEN